ncbi:TetR/AcrR family transcriptional regulator [Paenibacillus polymyxa]|jgi:AcrR family transcriptional regulator|uniref:TetR/AcrR family transcriptional regulator n=1 Tax=Paenibacillus TaxID=44249 RepID=UPI000311BACE|nr:MULTISPECIES: TetR/AcrR family transcriptional regulator [Paenibacillus]MDP9674164.1 AcrR family transcriptional regulator [Paenibacillus jamilae]AHM67349.1 bacterial regulatory s, tetR family protein [Paenibacillus polymyxa SQR-21]AUS27963.1 bacterial regulatory s, tetR family protein [Paenibacillus polymyxa]KAF6615619.1 TetR/AcrR family transcriptional regulator [Paenibacillus sp. EKM101P]KAF6619985.1 TetR/AcrR family transcriptional regulator [Paenibacillus sp. EKM102P]
MSMENQQDKAKNKLLKKLIPSLMKDGFQQMRMDDIAKFMDVSRATMYKNFSSKEEVIEGVVRIFVDYIEQLEDRTNEDDDRSFGVWFQQLFEQSVSLVGKISDVFLKDLQMVFPELYEVLKTALDKREQQTLKFYQDGKDKGVFNPINEKFILLQDDILLREIMNVKYLLYNQITIQQVLNDYYYFKKIQLFKPEKMSLVDDSRIHPVIEHFVEKFNRAL